MRYLTLVLICFMTVSCGKPPFMNKLEDNLKEVSGEILLSEISLKWTTPPSLDEMGVFDVTLSKPLKENQTLSAFIWMPDMGHGSSPMTMTQTTSLNFVFSEVAFIMPGLWVLHIQILENNTVVEEWQKSYTL